MDPLHYPLQRPLVASAQQAVASTAPAALTVKPPDQLTGDPEGGIIPLIARNSRVSC